MPVFFIYRHDADRLFESSLPLSVELNNKSGRDDHCTAIRSLEGPGWRRQYW
jgi:hypothetical protein